MIHWSSVPLKDQSVVLGELDIPKQVLQVFNVAGAWIVAISGQYVDSIHVNYTCMHEAIH